MDSDGSDSRAAGAKMGQIKTRARLLSCFSTFYRHNLVNALSIHLLLKY